MPPTILRKKVPLWAVVLLALFIFSLFAVNKLSEKSGDGSETKITLNESSSGMPIEHVVAPGGNTIYYVMSSPGKDLDGNQNTEIAKKSNGDAALHILLSPHPAKDPKENLTGFSHLTLSPDSKTLYFQAAAWATSNSIHAIHLATGKASYVTNGSIACVVLSGEYQGDLVVSQHRYFVQGGSHDDLWLYDPSGKEIGLVAQNTDASQRCPSLGN